jgi:hypothetical protein
MEERRFDDLTRRLAGSTSRRSVLKAVVVTAASAIGVMGGSAGAKGNSDAAHFCSSVFPPGPARGQCVSDAAHGTGLYYQCHGNPANVCQSASGVSCPDYTSDVTNCGSCGTVCPDGQPCLSGTCGCGFNQTLCGTTCVNQCDQEFGQVLNPTTCQCECPAGTVTLQTGACLQSCTTDSDCGPYGVCDMTTEGQQVCSDRGILTFCSPCTSSAGCQSGCFADNAYCSENDHLCH